MSADAPTTFAPFEAAYTVVVEKVDVPTLCYGCGNERAEVVVEGGFCAVSLRLGPACLARLAGQLRTHDFASTVR